MSLARLFLLALLAGLFLANCGKNAPPNSIPPKTSPMILASSFGLEDFDANNTDYRRSRQAICWELKIADAALTETHFAQLKKLGLFGTGITDLGPIGALPNLRRLNLQANKVIDLTPLAGLARLEILEASDNRITDVTPLVKLKALEDLQGHGQSVIDTILDINVPSPAPQVQEVKLLKTIRDLYRGTVTTDPDAFLATCGK